MDDSQERLRKLRIVVHWILFAAYWILFALALYFVVLRAASLLSDGNNNGCVDTTATPIELKVGQPASARKLFDTKHRCFDTGMHLQAGERYRVTIDTSATGAWTDQSIPSSPEGFDKDFDNYRPLMVFALPMRRHIKDSWFVLMGKIGRRGTVFRVGKDKRVRATETGRLYLYVNDAVPPSVFEPASKFYDNNIGQGKVTVTRLAE